MQFKYEFVVKVMKTCLSKTYRCLQSVLRLLGVNNISVLRLYVANIIRNTEYYGITVLTFGKGFYVQNFSVHIVQLNNLDSNDGLYE